MRGEVTLNVVQGIGDIFWVYQKFSRHVSRINFNIMTIDAHELDFQAQSRAVDFVRLFPKVGEVKVIEVSRERYSATANSVFPMGGILENGGGDYACNHALEQGVRIENIDPEYEIEPHVVLPELELPLPKRGYLAFYTSSPTTTLSDALGYGVWNVSRWAKLVELLYRRRVVSVPVVMLGAYYDRPALEAVRDRLKEVGIEVAALHIDLPPRFVLNLLRRCTLFIGHQSGLGVLADNLGAFQLMLYMKMISGMAYSWCRKTHAESGRFTAAFFDQTASEVLEVLRRRLGGYKPEAAPHVVP